MIGRRRNVKNPFSCMCFLLCAVATMNGLIHNAPQPVRQSSQKSCISARPLLTRVCYISAKRELILTAKTLLVDGSYSEAKCCTQFDS
ncbi:uncharacterized protein B0J16DRAFT_331006 [Fusarium flagelliforme]|uniref:uncharacterized protein n=1 Tax=Fusarium flagelliforme TaxID=2675880 RepID=UPI001E8E9DDB|nr:uncharacterized protein B0J16DRAFT_331006 [Fusarium flagelliforme]KAH7198724.1 hypothetical protein B0J16DRAFT_331006 [Fusarium flagelliforme]